MLRIAFGILVVVGIVGGTLTDAARDTPPAERGGYKVVEADFHVHSFFGDGLLSPAGLVSQARRQGLHVIAVTDHNQVFAAKFGRWFSRVVEGPTVLVGEEITAPGFHIIAVGLDERVAWRQSAAEAIEEIHRQDGVAIAAHPTEKYWRAFDEDIVQKLDGTEIMHPKAYASGGRWEEMRDFYWRAEASGHRLTAIGSSDYHWFNSLGICRTYVFARSNDENGILDAVRAGRTVVYDLAGNPYGEPELIRLLQAHPIQREVGNYNCSGSGVIDTIARACGWCGLIGLLLFGKEKRINSQ